MVALFISNKRSSSEIPFDPKMLKYPFEKNRFIKYNITSLEENYKWNIHTEQNLGININLLDPHAYESKLPPSAPLPGMDTKHHSFQYSTRSRHPSRRYDTFRTSR
jgi:RNA polymerase II-associated factor 1